MLQNKIHTKGIINNQSFGMIKKQLFCHPYFQGELNYQIKTNLKMAITNKITGTVKDVFALSKSLAKVVKEEVVSFNNERNDYNDEEDEVRDSSSMFKYIETFEAKAKEVIATAFSGFKTSKSEEQEELEERIAALEAKLSKLVEESLEELRKD